MTGVSGQVLDRLIAAAGGARPLALLFDYDGTLVPIVDHPSLAQLPSETRLVLDQLARLPRVTVGILSGRRLDDLKSLVGLTNLCYAGTSGLEVDMDGIRIAHPQAEEGRALIDTLVPFIDDIAARFPRAWVENKQLGLTLHYRGVEASLIASLRSATEEVLRSFGDRLRALDVAMAIEITAALGWTKASAVRTFVDRAGANALVLYAGDEANDQDAVEAVVELQGITIGVGPRAPAGTEYWLPEPAGVVELMGRVVDALQR